MIVEETWNDWYERYHAHVRSLGRWGMASAWRSWIAPHIGRKRVDAIALEDVEDVRDRLDDAIRRWRLEGPGRGRISGRTAMQAWWAMRGAFRAARVSKRRDLRVLAGAPDPCDGVEPPGDAEARRSRQKSFVYPAEFARVAACRAIPRAWRELHAIAAYTYARPGELQALQWRDVDLEHGTIQIVRARRPGGGDGGDGAEKDPKTRCGVREIPIEVSLAPLLHRMRRGRSRNDPVLEVLSSVHHTTLAVRMRHHLERAGVRRTALHESTRTTVRANFRSWRDSGITWLAMKDVGLVRIMRRAGHADIHTTARYIKLAEDLDGELGVPFPPLPSALVDGR